MDDRRAARPVTPLSATRGSRLECSPSFIHNHWEPSSEDPRGSDSGMTIGSIEKSSPLSIRRARWDRLTRLDGESTFVHGTSSPKSTEKRDGSLDSSKTQRAALVELGRFQGETSAPAVSFRPISSDRGVARKLAHCNSAPDLDQTPLLHRSGHSPQLLNSAWSDSSSSSGSLMSERGNIFSLRRDCSSVGSRTNNVSRSTRSSSCSSTKSSDRDESPSESAHKAPEKENQTNNLTARQHIEVESGSSLARKVSGERPIIRDLFAAKRLKSSEMPPRSAAAASAAAPKKAAEPLTTPISSHNLSHAGACKNPAYSSAPRTGATAGQYSVRSSLGTGKARGSILRKSRIDKGEIGRSAVAKSLSVRFQRHGSASSIDSIGSTDRIQVVDDGFSSSKERCASPFDPEHLLSTKKPPASSSPQKLTKTNFRRLKRELEVQEEKLRELKDQSLIRAKDKNLRRMVHTTSSFIFVVFLSTVMYCNYVMLAPHLNAVLLSGLLSVVLSSVRQQLTSRFDGLRQKLSQFWIKWDFGNDLVQRTMALGEEAKGCTLTASVAAACSVAFLALLISSGTVALVVAKCAVAALVILASSALIIWTVDPRSLTAGILTTFVLCALVIPFSVALFQCAKEAERVTSFFLVMIDSDETLQASVESLASSPIYQYIRDPLIDLTGYDPLEYLLSSNGAKGDGLLSMKASVRQLAVFTSANMKAFSGNVLSVASNVSSILWAFTTFSTTLYYLLNNESPWEIFQAVSPLSPQDNIDLYNDVRESTIRILLCSITILLLHFGGMYIVLASSGLDLVAIPSFACGLFSVLPIAGTYVVFVPVALLLLSKELHVHALLVVSIELAMTLLLDARITSYIPGDSHFVALSIVAGLYSFGVLGFLYGPLLVVLAGAVVRIYVKYLKKPLTRDINSPAPARRNLFP